MGFNDIATVCRSTQASKSKHVIIVETVLSCCPVRNTQYLDVTWRVLPVQMWLTSSVYHLTKEKNIL